LKKLRLEALEERRVLAIDALMDDALVVDNNSSGDADPGDTIEYTVTINNTGPSDATNVQFSADLDDNAPLVPGSINVSPLAFDDSYVGLGNTPFTIDAAHGVLANDVDPDHSTSPLTNTDLVAVNLDTTDTVGSVSLNADGSFTYTPAVGFTGNDTFQYTARDEDNLDSVVTGTVTITINNAVWYVNNTAPGGGDGSFANPFNAINSFNLAGTGGGGDVDGSGETTAPDGTNPVVYPRGYLRGLAFLQGLFFPAPSFRPGCVQFHRTPAEHKLESATLRFHK
jgi:uncharacterized repeat protein (TIGR01451 family)